jgi:dolichyl-phosphate-mannose--protein O-mannosyl transferase
MRNLIALPVIVFSVILQSAVISRITLLSGYADLPLVMLAAWSLQDQVDTAWHWAVATGILVGFVSGINWLVPLVGYLVVVVVAKLFQRRVWRVPLLAMFSVTFIGTIVMNILSMAVLRVAGISVPLLETFGLVILPCVLLNLLLSIPVYAVMRDLAYWTYPFVEAG